MILATRKPNGKVVYFDARNGNQYKPGREIGRHMGHIPDDVIRFLRPKIERKIKVDPIKGMDNSNGLQNHMQESAPKNPSWIQRLIAWIKKLFGNAGK